MKTDIEIYVHASPGFRSLCQHFLDMTNLDILELGPARGCNIEFWTHFSTSIFVADFRARLPLPPLEEEQEFPESEWHRILEIPAGRYFDIILAWDLMNYIEATSLPGLINHLNRYCKQGTILFTMLIDQPQMPEDSCVFRIIDEENLGYETSGSGLRECPRLQPRVLENTMRGFRTSDCYRLRHGIIEYLFSYIR
jgi:hypothetical protein